MRKVFVMIGLLGVLCFSIYNEKLKYSNEFPLSLVSEEIILNEALNTNKLIFKVKVDCDNCSFDKPFLLKLLTPSNKQKLFVLNKDEKRLIPNKVYTFEREIDETLEGYTQIYLGDINSENNSIHTNKFSEAKIFYVGSK